MSKNYIDIVYFCEGVWIGISTTAHCPWSWAGGKEQSQEDRDENTSSEIINLKIIVLNRFCRFCVLHIFLLSPILAELDTSRSFGRDVSSTANLRTLLNTPLTEFLGQQKGKLERNALLVHRPHTFLLVHK